MTVGFFVWELRVSFLLEKRLDFLIFSDYNQLVLMGVESNGLSPYEESCSPCVAGFFFSIKTLDLQVPECLVRLIF